MKQPLLLKTLLIILLVAIFSISCEKKSSQPETTQKSTSDKIKIGVYYPLTGDIATFGQFGKKGVEMAVAEVNAQGGLLGRQIEAIYEDTRGQQQDSTIAVQKLIDKDKVVAVLGESASTNSLAGGAVCQEKKIPMITPSSTNPTVTQIGDYIFRICFLDDFQGEVMARFAVNTLKAKRVAVLYDNGSDYSIGLDEFFSATLKKLGGEIVAKEAYQKADVDFSAQLTKIKGSKPDAIYVPGYYTQVGQIAQQTRKLGMTIPILGADGWDSPSLIEIGKEALNGCYFSNHYNVEDPDPRVSKFVGEFKTKYNSTPDTTAGLAYDATYILFAAIKKANSTESKAIRDAISETKNYPGITGDISISKERNAIKSAVIVGIEKGRYVVKEKMSPIDQNVAENK
ncbi:MAG: ABC transporter substrate-binding protein [Acidobacteria bacterium]|nr:ABC transporter substrate-binding protein [Acidobacteriota bacterium]